MEGKTDTILDINQEVMKTIQEKIEANQQKMGAIQEKVEVMIKSGQEKVKATVSGGLERNGDCNKLHSVSTGRDNQKSSYVDQKTHYLSEELN
jgi:hypothetical protein